MSVEIVNEEATGTVAMSTWHHQNHPPSQPFLSRNLKKAVKYATMGSMYSKPFSKPPPTQERVILESDEEENEDLRPAKRRKTPTPDANPNIDNRNGIDSSWRSRSGDGSSRSPQKQIHSTSVSHSPNSRNVHRKKVSHNELTRVDSMLKLTKGFVGFNKIFQIQVNGINHDLSHDDDDCIGGNGSSRIRCTLTLFHMFRLPGDEEDTMDNIHRGIQTGTLKTSFETGISLVSLPPFFIPAAVLFEGQDIDLSQQGVLDFGKSTFRAQLIIEPQPQHGKTQKSWPPLTASDLPRSSGLANKLSVGQAKLNDIKQLVCEFPLFESDWKEDSTQIRVTHGLENVVTLASLNVDILWTLPSHLTKTDTITRSQERIQKIATPSLVGPPSPEKSESLDSRIQRRRANAPTSYNLKVLSDAQKPLRISKNRNSRSNNSASPADTLDQSSVTYTFGRADYNEHGIKQRQHIVTGLKCAICSSNHKSVEGLHFHLTTNHERYRFHLRRATPPKIAFLIEKSHLSRGTSRTIHDPLRILQLGKPSTLLNMEEYLNGDRSWLKERHGPQHEQWPDHLKHQRHEPILTPSSQNSRHASPEKNGVTPFSLSTKLTIRPRKKFYVPQTNTKLHDLISKRLLVVGEELPDSDDEKDESWLKQKQGDIILDHTDVTDDEKDYLLHWNDYIMNLRLTCDIHLETSLIRFVDLNKIWFAERKSRVKQIMKHIEANTMRDSVTQKVVYDCANLLREGLGEYAKMEKTQVREEVEKEKENNPSNMKITPRKKVGRDPNICECGEVTRSMTQVICQRKTCLGAFFHPECAAKYGPVVNRRNWTCPHCLEGGK